MHWWPLLFALLVAFWLSKFVLQENGNISMPVNSSTASSLMQKVIVRSTWIRFESDGSYSVVKSFTLSCHNSGILRNQLMIKVQVRFHGF